MTTRNIEKLNTELTSILTRLQGRLDSVSIDTTMIAVNDKGTPALTTEIHGRQVTLMVFLSKTAISMVKVYVHTDDGKRVVVGECGLFPGIQAVLSQMIHHGAAFQNTKSDVVAPPVNTTAPTSATKPVVA